jgi:hypothetical protein
MIIFSSFEETVLSLLFSIQSKNIANLIANMMFFSCEVIIRPLLFLSVGKAQISSEKLLPKKCYILSNKFRLVYLYTESLHI